MPATGKLSITSGDSYTITIPIYNPDGTAPNLSGASGDFWIGQNVNATGTSVFLRVSTSTGASLAPQTINGVSVYVLTVPLPESATKLIPAGVLYYEARVIDASQNVSHISRGQCVVNGTMIPAP